MYETCKKPLKYMQAAVNIKTQGPNDESKKHSLSKTIRKCR